MFECEGVQIENTKRFDFLKKVYLNPTACWSEIEKKKRFNLSALRIFPVSDVIRCQ